MALTPEAKQVLRQARALRKLIAYPEWQVYSDLLQERADTAGTAAVSESATWDAVLPKEFQKGVLSGIRYAMTIVGVTIATAEDIRERNPGEFKQPSPSQQDVDEGPTPPSHPTGNAP